MKKSLKFAFYLIILLSFLKCNDRDEENVISNFEPVKIDSVRIPQDSMDVFTIQTITTFSNYKSNCEGFYGYDYIHGDNFTRNVTAYKFSTKSNCEDVKTHPSQINFRPQLKGIYVFKFYNGLNSSGEPLYIEKKIKVN